jgi:hypothetical protein
MQPTSGADRGLHIGECQYDQRQAVPVFFYECLSSIFYFYICLHNGGRVLANLSVGLLRNFGGAFRHRLGYKVDGDLGAGVKPRLTQ